MSADNPEEALTLPSLAASSPAEAEDRAGALAMLTVTGSMMGRLGLAGEPPPAGGQ